MNFAYRGVQVTRFLPLLYPAEWRAQNPNFFENLPTTNEIIPIKTIQKQWDAILNWDGTCNKLNTITQPTLVIVGSDDMLTPPGNSLLISSHITGSWFVQIQGRGHTLSSQYPEKFSNVILSFLAS